MNASEIVNVLKDVTVKDIQAVEATAKLSGMKVAMSEFEERNNAIRVKRFILVGTGFDKQYLECKIVTD